MGVTASPTIEIIRGDDTYINCSFKESVEGIITPIDITGYKIYFTVKKKLNDSDLYALIQVDVTSHSDPTLGKTIIVLSHGLTDDLSEGNYFYDLQLKDTGGLISSTRRGMFNVIEDVTKRIN